jgi:hypothetical protein
MKVRVISDTCTFYPVENEEEAHHGTDNMTLRTTLVYLREQMGEDFQFLIADDLFLVLQQWRGIVFFIQSNDPRYQEVMRLQLQTIREILIFLFGVKFETVMKFRIVQANRIVFTQYVDAYLSACQADYLCSLGTIRNDYSCPHVSEHFLQAAAELLPEFDLNLLSCMLFNRHQLVARFIVPDAVQFHPETFFMLSIFERVEYDSIAEELDEKFSTAYVTSADNRSMKHKTAFLRIERTPVACAISSTRCALNSPFVILVVAENVSQKRKTGNQMKMVDFLTAITSKLKSLVVRPVEPRPVEVVEDLLHYVVIDRTHGWVCELPAETTVRLIKEYRRFANDGEAEEETKRVKNQLAAYGMSAMMRGFTTMIWGELTYHFCYELVFEDDAGDRLKPTQVFSPPPFNDDTGINYRLIADSIFQAERQVTCIELLAVYRGRIQVKAAMAANQTLIEIFKRLKRPGALSV